MRWRIYYGDGSTFSDKDGPPEAAPVTDVQVVAVEAPNEQGFILRHSRDVYVFKQEWWAPCDIAGLWDHLLLHPNPKIIIFGRTTRDEEFWSIVGRAGKEGLG